MQGAAVVTGFRIMMLAYWQKKPFTYMKVATF